MIKLKFRNISRQKLLCYFEKLFLQRSEVLPAQLDIDRRLSILKNCFLIFVELLFYLFNLFGS